MKLKIKWDVVQSGISIVALLVSAASMFITLRDTNSAVKEREEAHKPIIKIWDQEINEEIIPESGIIDLLQLECSNIGEGIAQDIKVEISPEEQKNIALQCEKILESCTPPEMIKKSDAIDYGCFYFSDLLEDQFTFWYDKEGGELDYFCFGDEYFRFDLTVCNNKAYMLPVTESTSVSYNILSEGLSKLLFNTFAIAAYYEESMKKTISFDVELSYKDIYEKVIKDPVTVEISLIESNIKFKMDDENNQKLYLRLQVDVSQDDQKAGND